MSDNPLLRLRDLGQSIWLDFIRRSMITSGELARLIEEDGVQGFTSNPTIFDKAIAGSHDYDPDIRALALEGKSAKEIYEALAIEDLQAGCDVLRRVFDATGGADGHASFEVSPYLAHDVEGTMAEARRMWAAIDRRNLFIKVPATKDGLECIRRLTAEGVNVNVTLLFGLPRYRDVAEAYVAGLEERVEAGKPIDGLHSVASFFLSRIDVLIDPTLEKAMAAAGREAAVAQRLHGQAAIASAKIAYQIYQETVRGARWGALAEKGAHPQRVLWASTGTKNPAYSDVKYVEPLIGPDTINTMPLETLDAYRDHGDPAPRLEEGIPEAVEVLDLLRDVGIHIDDATQQLEDEGVQKFIDSLDSVVANLEKKRAEALGEAA